MPSKDYYGFKNSSIKIKIEDLENEFKKIVGKDFKVLDLIYSNKEENEKYGINTNRYVLYRYSKDNLERKVDYLILSNPDYFNDFETSQIMFGRFSSIIIEKPETIIYFDYYDYISNKIKSFLCSFYAYFKENMLFFLKKIGIKILFRIKF